MAMKSDDKGQSQWHFIGKDMLLDLRTEVTRNYTLPHTSILANYKQNKQTPWSESASEPYRPNDRFSSKSVPTFADVA
jgi:hypothetical protein